MTGKYWHAKQHHCKAQHGSIPYLCPYTSEKFSASPFTRVMYSFGLSVCIPEQYTWEREARTLSGILCKEVDEKTEGSKGKSGNEEHMQALLMPSGKASAINLCLNCTFNIFPLTWRKYSPSSVTPLRFLTSLQLLGNSPETNQKGF